ncbi:9f4568dc-8f11-44be-af54-441a9b849f20 [Thermothielavioides terrestris]|uniref:9f4568dc-8f11-44be-af54-441a9b849f20 n=1 Tax=Thermothielavioides terrestris TaxID=2587410 RepID=A0A3S4AS28_9PEZI|nr:9f4568dc-8f11-44be-af54-441a9b849f20 [Thermothielavioides terrestris]
MDKAKEIVDYKRTSKRIKKKGK